MHCTLFTFRTGTCYGDFVANMASCPWYFIFLHLFPIYRLASLAVSEFRKYLASVGLLLQDAASIFLFFSCSPTFIHTDILIFSVFLASFSSYTRYPLPQHTLSYLRRQISAKTTKGNLLGCFFLFDVVAATLFSSFSHMEHYSALYTRETPIYFLHRVHRRILEIHQWK